MRRVVRIGVLYSLLLMPLLAAAGVAKASVVVDIDRSSQRMAVSIDGAQRYNWRVSTARAGYVSRPASIIRR